MAIEFPLIGLPCLAPRPDSELAIPWLTRNSKRRTTDARRSRPMEHAAAGLCKMLSLGHADFTLTLFDDSVILPKKQLKRQRSVNDRPVPPQSRLLWYCATFCPVCTRQIELELAAARERAEGDEPDFKLDIDMLLGGGRSAGAQTHTFNSRVGLTSPTRPQVLGSRSARDQPRDGLIPLSQRRRRRPEQLPQLPGRRRLRSSNLRRGRRRSRGSTRKKAGTPRLTRPASTIAPSAWRKRQTSRWTRVATLAAVGA